MAAGKEEAEIATPSPVRANDGSGAISWLKLSSQEDIKREIPIDRVQIKILFTFIFLNNLKLLKGRLPFIHFLVRTGSIDVTEKI